MAFNVFFLPGLFALVSTLLSVTFAENVESILDVATLNRKHFPAGFMFGASSAAYQYEGAAEEDGKGVSIWDTFTHEHPDRIKDRSNGDVAEDQYHRFEEDIRIMKDMNLDTYRLSISWSRLLPEGKLSGRVNEAGVKHYRKLFRHLTDNGIQPFVTLFHWDLPQALEYEYLGFLDKRIINDFRDYAELCFHKFGDLVKYWTTFNEPWAFSAIGYALGATAPGRCSKYVNPNCTDGNSGTEPYLVSHHQLLAHAAAVKVYKEKFQASQKGVIGITLVTTWFVPFSDNKSDHEAAGRANDFMFGWFMDPLTTGAYPQSMQTLVGERLPNFTREEVKLLIGSFDFIGINYYYAGFVANEHTQSSEKPNFFTDSNTNQSPQGSATFIDPRALSDWSKIYPKGLQEFLLYIKNNYSNPLIYITENGMEETNIPTLSLQEALIDTFRIDYFYRHLFYVQSAIRQGVNVKGYFAWSLLDDFEWIYGYTKRFGLNFVDFQKGLKRHPKLSARWFKNFLKRY